MLVTPNETETEILTGIKVTDEKSAFKASSSLLNKGVQHIIITMGSSGAYYCNKDKHAIVPAPKVVAVDTTAAGDVFNGALAVALGENRSFEDAILFANSAAAISVTRLGAQNSAPYRNEIK